MKLFIPLLFASILILGFDNQDDKYPYTDFVPNGKGLVRFHFVNVTDTINYRYFYNTHLPVDQFKKLFLIYSDSLIEIEVNANQPTINYFQEKSVAQFLVLPNDTIDVFIDRKKPSSFPEMISFKGKTALISEYLTRGKLWLYDNFPDKNESSEHYNYRIDNVYKSALKKLDDFNSKYKLPEWFMEFEKMNIICHCEQLKLMQYNQRYFKYNQFIEHKAVPTYDMKKNEMKINWLSDNTINYLYENKPKKYDTLLGPFTTDIYFEYIQDNINALKGRLSDKTMSYFVASRLSAALQDGIQNGKSNSDFNVRCKKVDSLFNEMTPLITDTVILKFINEYRVKEYEHYLNQKKLIKGQMAPVFYLEDINNSKVKLSDFKGKLICLDFWATWCGPCIRSIPMKNEIVQKFKDKDFVLVNILMDYDFKRWKEIIEEKKFEGIHLKCKGNWEKLLKEKYCIKGVPHYTLIDKSGNILISDVPRDSLAFYVESNL